MEKELSPKFLAANCYSSESEKIKRSFTNEEINQMQIKVSNLNVNLERRNLALAYFKNAIKISEEIGLKEAIDHIKNLHLGEKPVVVCNKELKTLIDHLDRGFIEEEIDVYWMYDSKKKQMHIYNADGTYLKSRPLTQEEKNNPVMPTDLPDEMGESNFGEDEENPDDNNSETELDINEDDLEEIEGIEESPVPSEDALPFD